VPSLPDNPTLPGCRAARQYRLNHHNMLRRKQFGHVVKSGERPPSAEVP